MLKTSLLLSVLLVLPLLFTFDPPKTALFEQCNCSHLEVLQLELRNAQKLQQAFRNKISHLRSLSHEQSMQELKRFSETDARSGLESLPNYKGAAEVDYVASGDNLYDPTKPPANATNESLCRMSPDSELSLQTAMQKAACDGIGNSIKAHEDVHKSSCMRRGYVNFFKMGGADRAQDEVDAYGAQINALKAEIAQVLERAQLTIVSDVNTLTTVPPNPLYQSIKVDNRSEIPATRVSGSNDRFVFEGQAPQTTDVSVQGNCTVSGVPFTIPAKVTIDTDGQTANVKYELVGTMPTIGMRCTIPGMGSGSGMSVPVPMNAGKIPIATFPLKDGAEKVSDMAQSDAAKMMASGGVKLTGTATIRLKCK